MAQKYEKNARNFKEGLAAVEDKIEDDKPMTKANKIMLFLILGAEFFWFMADNGIGTFMNNYTIYYLGAKTSSNMINTIVGGVGSVLGFGIGGYIAAKIGRKWTVVAGLALSLLAYLAWLIATYTFLSGFKEFPSLIYILIIPRRKNFVNPFSVLTTNNFFQSPTGWS